MGLVWTFGRKLGAGFAAAAAVLLVVGFVGHQSTVHLVENDRLVSHTHRARRELAAVISDLKDTETGQRGFVVTGDDAFLEPYHSGLVELERSYAELRTLTADNPTQQRRLDALRPLVDAKLAELRRVLDQRRAGGFEPAARTMAQGDGKRMMDQIRRIVGEMDQEEVALLTRRREMAEASARAATAVVAWGSALGVLLVAAFGVLISRSLTRQIGAAVRHIQSSSAELQAAANQQATGAKEQATAMNEITTTISELLATSRQIASSAQRVAHIADQTMAAARSGDAIVENGNASTAGTRRQVDVIVAHMLELGKKSQQIGTVLDIVSELAEQTNILSINATIEAAGAGDAGKRFAVVADEIRKLADRVAGSTKEVRGLIDDVRGAVNTTVMTTETGSKAVEAGARQFAEVAAAFRQISAQLVTTTEAAREIGLSTKQQTTAVEQVNVAVTNVAQASKESEVSTTQTLRTASELAELSRDLLRIVQPRSSDAGRGHALA